MQYEEKSGPSESPLTDLSGPSGEPFKSPSRASHEPLRTLSGPSGRIRSGPSQDPLEIVLGPSRPSQDLVATLSDNLSGIPRSPLKT
eukprot:7489307-Pyramimonas_sp.AAC.1